MCIQSRERPLGVPTREDMEALVIDLDEMEASEKSMWMGKRMGKVVRRCKKECQTDKGDQRHNTAGGIRTYNNPVGTAHRS